MPDKAVRFKNAIMPMTLDSEAFAGDGFDANSQFLL